MTKAKQIKEPFYKSRRIWAVGLTLVATIGIAMAPDKYAVIEAVALIIASVLGLRSWVFPKK